jgi:protein-S-isoprenylcysteine O-methyltransferase Ste14
MCAGGVLFLAGLIRQGRSLTVSARPRDGAALIQDGPYAVVRHPMYSGLLALACGWALFLQSWLTLAYAAALFVVLDLKARREERWLLERFAAYGEYRRRVRRLVPFVY